MTLRWGQPSRRVCWIPQPSSLDAYLPEDHTIEYRLNRPYGYRGAFNRETFFSTIDREEARRVSASCYMSGELHVIETVWRNPEGQIVKKMPIVQQWKRENT